MKKFLLILSLLLIPMIEAAAQTTPHISLKPTSSQPQEYKNKYISLQYPGNMQKYEENKESTGYYCVTFSDNGRTQIRIIVQTKDSGVSLSNREMLTTMADLYKEQLKAQIGNIRYVKLAGDDAYTTDLTCVANGIELKGTMTAGSSSSCYLIALILTKKGESDALCKQIQESIKYINNSNFSTRTVIGSFDVKGNDDAVGEVLKAKERVDQSSNSRYDTNVVYDVVEQMPSFPGGNAALMEYLSQHVKYPSAAQKAGIQGRVVISFVVEKDGSITGVKCVRNVSPLLDSEGERVVREMPKWIPGKQSGKPVRVKYNVPVSFKLQ